jgi:hypothetical protein
MTGPRKPKEPSKAEVAVNMMDKLMSQVDPEVLLAGVLGAVATAGGITPPLTRMLQAFSLGNSVDLGSDITNAAGNTWYDVAKWGSPLLYALGLTFGSSEVATAEDVKKQTVTRGLVAAGAMEGMMMMAFMKNPGSMQFLSGIVGTAAKVV